MNVIFVFVKGERAKGDQLRNVTFCSLRLIWSPHPLTSLVVNEVWQVRMCQYVLFFFLTWERKIFTFFLRLTYIIN